MTRGAMLAQAQAQILAGSKHLAALGPWCRGSRHALRLAQILARSKHRELPGAKLPGAKLPAAEATRRLPIEPAGTSPDGFRCDTSGATQSLAPLRGDSRAALHLALVAEIAVLALVLGGVVWLVVALLSRFAA